MQAAALAALGAYRRFVSPLLPRSCRFHPTCSEYAIAAITAHGFGHGARLACLRLLRCQPFSHGGFDPVPAAPRHPIGTRGWTTSL
jgi:putative membrane protein insertion efficiency factor